MGELRLMKGMKFWPKLLFAADATDISAIP